MSKLPYVLLVLLAAPTFAQDPSFNYADLRISHVDFGDDVTARHARITSFWEVAEPFMIVGKCTTLKYDTGDVPAGLEIDTTGTEYEAGVGVNQKYMNGLTTYLTASYASIGVTLDLKATALDERTVISERLDGYAVAGGLRLPIGDSVQLGVEMSRHKIDDLDPDDAISGLIEYRINDQFAVNTGLRLGISDDSPNNLSVGVRYYFE